MSSYDDEDYESFDLGEDDPELLARDPDEDDPEEDDPDEDEDDELFDDDDEDDLDDATEDDIDLIVGFYREDGEVIAQALNADAANDLDELITQLRRLPGEAGAAAFVSLAQEVFCAVRVRGRNVQALVSDAAAAGEWPLCRDIADYLGAPDADPDDDPVPLGDLTIFADLGVSELDMMAITEELDEDTDDLVLELADRINVGPQVRKIVDAEFS